MIPEINIWAVLWRPCPAWWSDPSGTRQGVRQLLDGVAKVTPSGDARDAVKPILITLLVSLISAWVLAGSAAISQHFYGGNFLANTLVTALILWAGFTAARFVTHDAFEGRPAGLTALNCAHELVTLMVMALIIGLFGISAG